MGFGGKDEKGEGIKKYKLSDRKSGGHTFHEKMTAENILNNTVITIYGIRRVLALSTWILCKLYKCLITMSYTWN